jgi:isochorismate synthase
MNFLQAIKYCIDSNLIFATYRLPNSDTVRLIVQKSEKANIVSGLAEIIGKQGFYIAPFDAKNGTPAYFIQPDLNYISTDYSGFDELKALLPIPLKGNCFENGAVSKKDFLLQVTQIKEAIHSGMFEKAVVSRIKIVERSYRSRLTEIFQLLLSSYNNAFVYLFNIEGETWMGATPEPLLCSNKNEVEAVSLAATREYNAENLNLQNWGVKEKREQELVTLYIESVFSTFGIHTLSKRGPYTKKAGNLIHLRTDFAIDLRTVSGKLSELIGELHPTSAVCGYPKKKAMKFIKGVEKHNRGFYSGFLGPVNIDEKMLFFVNLRCMKIMCDKLILHIGAGITSDSVPEEEWDETEIKADTLLSVIHKV